MRKAFIGLSLVLLFAAGGCAATNSAAPATAAETKVETVAAVTDTAAAAETGNTAEIVPLDYSDRDNWAYTGTEENRDCDVFFIAPTNVAGDADYLIADMSNGEDKDRILASIGMQTGIYNETGRFFAPYYRQITLAAYLLDETERLEYLKTSYVDVDAAFDWYMEHENNGRPFIIAGFSQGAEHAIKLVKDHIGNSDFADKFIAAYIIGWRMTDDDLKECELLKMAQSETDTGVCICFECEAESVEGSIILPEDTFSYSINPLNWKTDSTPASKEENLGFVYPAADGSVKKEIPQLCGAYIDPKRGALKVTDVTPEQYPAILQFMPEGSYHIYDYEFFYRNLQANVKVRTESWFAAH